MDHKFTSPKEIVELNIEHYSRLLQTDLDERTRSAVETLLAAEKAKLASLQQRARGQRGEPKPRS